MPVEVDILFKETVQQLKVSPSERIRINLIDRFLEAISGFERNYQSYLIQLVEELPSLPNPMLFAGIHPSNLKGFIGRLETARSLVLELSNNEMLESRIDEYKSILGQILQWIGASTLDEGVQTKLVESKPSKTSITPGEVIVPVFEEFNGITAGRLRRLKVEIIGPTKNAHEIKPNFGVVGAEIGNFAKTMESAVSALADESEGTKHRFWKASIQFELPHAWHTGSSANLAMAGAFFGEQMKAEEQQELFWLNPAACITGDLDEQGNVLAVNPQTIPQKVEAAFFSWCQLLIVPSEQLTEVHEHITELNAEFPNRRLPIVGVSHLRELFYDRRVTFYSKESIMVHAVKKAWRRRKSLGAISLIISLFVVISSMVYGPVDRNPVQVHFSGTKVIYKNSLGKEVYSKEIGRNAVKLANENDAFSTIAGNLIDVNGDYINEIIWSNYPFDTNKKHEMYIGNIEGDTMQVITLDRDFTFKYHDYILPSNYIIDQLDRIDINNDSIDELIIIANHPLYYPSILIILDTRTGEILYEVLHPGHILHFSIFDIDEDNFDEVIIGGINNYYKMGFISLIDSFNYKGQISFSEEYSEMKLPKIIPKKYIVFPPTHLSRINRSIGEGFYTEVKNIKKVDGKIAFQVSESIDENNLFNRQNVNLQYLLNMDFEVIQIAPSDDYDILSKTMSNEMDKSLTSMDKYLSSFKDSLIHLNGN